MPYTPPTALSQIGHDRSSRAAYLPAGVDLSRRVSRRPTFEERRCRAAGLDALHAASFARRFPPHFHDTFAIGAIESGTVVVRTTRGVWNGGAGTILAFAPGVVHRADPVDASGWTYRMLYPSAELLRDLGLVPGNASSSRVFARSVCQDGALASRLATAPAALMSNDGTVRAEGGLVKALRLLVARHPRVDTTGTERACDLRAVASAREHLNEHFNRTIWISELAEICDLSPFISFVCSTAR